jgi:UDP-N-acetylmuramyl pentapeptide phosphotransferase/UDP-N-acetylglucosamine-1-phosphate transferase
VGTLLTAGGLACAFSLLLTPLFVRLFKRLELGQFDSLIGSIENDLYLRLSQMFAAEKALLTLGGIAFSAGIVLAIVGTVRFRRHTGICQGE